MFRKIVVALDTDHDRSRQLIETAREMAKAFHSRVLVAHVRQVELQVSMLATAGRAGLPPSVTPEADDGMREAVKAAVDELSAAGIDAYGRVTHGQGSTARELLDITQKFDADLVIVGDRDSRLTDVLLGGVANRIVHLAQCPVLVVR